jgi:hypothetical protein
MNENLNWYCSYFRQGRAGGHPRNAGLAGILRCCGRGIEGRILSRTINMLRHAWAAAYAAVTNFFYPSTL